MAEKLDPKAAGARRLEGKVCIVTEAGQGIGKATAKRLGEEGGCVNSGSSLADRRLVWRRSRRSGSLKD